MCYLELVLLVHSALCVNQQEFQEKIVQHQIELHSTSGEVKDSLLENLAFKTTEIEKLRDIVKEYWNVNNVRIYYIANFSHSLA